MDRYSEYKPSSIQWLRELPSHWEERKVKYCFIERSEKNHPNEPVLCATQSQGVIPQSLYQNRVVAVNKGFEELKFVRVGHFVISLRSFEGGIEYAFYQGIISAAYTILEPIIKENVQYFRLLFKSHFFIQLLQTCVTGIREGQNINYQLLGRKFIPIPPLAEQKKIVNFLNNKISRIDEFLLVKEEQIKLLQELKESETANVITRGLNPNVKMKSYNSLLTDSCPEHWEIKRNKSFLSLTGEKVGERANDFVLLSLTTKGVIVRDIESGKGKFPKDFGTYQVVKKDDLILCLFDIDETPRTIGLVETEGMITGAYTALQVDKEYALPEYIYYYYFCVDNIKGLKPYYSGLRKTVRADKFLQLYLPLPSLHEQQAIVLGIKKMCSKVNSLITELEAEIEYLKEYKQSLIADCVTGQINVQQQ